ncbi:APC family permease [soil metagenome]
MPKPPTPRKSVAQTTDAAPVQPALKRVIGVGGVAFTSFNTIVGAGIFGLPALVAAVLGPAAILAYLLCAGLIALVGLCFAEAGSRVSDSGGLYAYARAAFGPVVAGIAGMLLLVANSIAASAALARFLVETLAGFWPAADGAAVRTAILAAVYLVLAAVNMRGARQGARLATVMAVVKLAPLITLAVVGSFSIAPANLQWTQWPSMSSFGQGAVLLFFAFMGVEAGLGTSGETRDPARTIPRAIVLALTLVATLYIALQLVAQGVLGAALPTETAPLVATATAVFGPWGTRLLLATTLLSATGYLVADVLSSPRIAYALAEAGQLPRRFAAVHPRFGTPAVAIGSYAALCFVMAATGSFRQLVLLASSGTLALYLIGCLGVLRLRSRGVAMAGEPFRASGGAAVPLLAAAIIVWMLLTLEWSELASAGGLIVAAALVYGIQERLRRGRHNQPRSANETT